jgi:rhodanese-related sulfurtransferase
MKEITAEELKKLKDSGEDFQLIDVREEYEYEEMNLGGTLIPMGEISSRTEEVARDKKVVIHCRSGKRSAAVIAMLERDGFANLYNLKGGILAWVEKYGI